MTAETLVFFNDAGNLKSLVVIISRCKKSKKKKDVSLRVSKCNLLIIIRQLDV